MVRVGIHIVIAFAFILTFQGCATLSRPTPTPALPIESIPSDTPPAIRKMMETLYSDQALERARAAGILGELKARQAAPYLASMLHDNSGNIVRKSPYFTSIKDLSWWERTKITETSNPIDTTPGMEAAVALLWMGEHELVTKALRDENEVIRIQASRALKEWDDPKAADPLIAVYDDKNEIVRENVVLGLSKHQGPKVVDCLITMLDDNSKKIVRKAALLLGDKNDTRAVEPLIRKLENQKDAYITINTNKSLYALTGQRPLSYERWMEWLEREGSRGGK